MKQHWKQAGAFAFAEATADSPKPWRRRSAPASVPVTIRFSKDNTTSLTVRLVRQSGSWKIANLTDGKEIDLLAYLKRLPAKVS